MTSKGFETFEVMLGPCPGDWKSHESKLDSPRSCSSDYRTPLHCELSHNAGVDSWDNTWILPLAKGYTRENYLGMTAVEYGGAAPVVDVWREDCGVAVGHVEMVPTLVSMPVSTTAENEAMLGNPGLRLRTQYRTRHGQRAGRQTQRVLHEAPACES